MKLTKTLTKKQARALRPHCHALKPTVIVGQNGLTDNVVAEIDGALEHHELIKVRINAGDQKDRDAMIDEINTRLKSSLIVQIGHIVALYRENRDKQRYASEIPSS